MIMNNKKKQEIPLEAFDNELIHQEIIIPDDFKATIEGNKIILTKTENKDERIKNRLIKLIKMSSEVGGFALHKWEADEMLAWLEKQDTERKQLYVRFGDIPSNEKSKIYHGEEEIGDENGVSVYPAFELNGNIVLGLTLPITKTTLYTQQHLLEYDNRPCYLVSGDYVGNGTDGEPLIKNISVIKRLDNYRIKECEKKPAIEMITPEESLGIDSETYNKIVDECIYGCDKQKSADKIEPKFKVGNWYQCTKDFFGKGVTFDKNTAYYCAKEGCLQNEYGCHIAIVKGLYDNFKLWTIQDAKDGDVLFHSDSASNGIFIFKEILQRGTIQEVVCYCDYDSEDGFCLGEKHTCCWTDSKILHPATKEQRDILFQKMKEAGYEWDAEKKELRKIHVIDEGKAEMDYCFTKMMNGEKVSSAWNEEDEKMVNDIIAAIDTLYYHGMVKWLKSLKQRFAWKPSDEQMDALNEKMPKTDEEMINEEMLNEEMINEEMLKNDEEMLKAAICLIKGVNNDTCHGGFACNGIHKDDVINWLEDLLACY
jgi:hypothetical protein